MKRFYSLIAVVAIALPLCGAPGNAQAQVTETILHSFRFNDGISPLTTPIQGQDGAYYGTAQQGGNFGVGTVYRIASTGTLTILHDFNGSDGVHAYGGLVQGSDGTLYGTAVDGGSNNLGTVYKLHPDGTGFMVLHNFAGSDGAEPLGALTLGHDGMIYGMTHDNGASNYGTVFQMSTDGSVFNVIHNFSGPDGQDPDAGIIQGRDGMLYGTTGSGGAYSYGVAFQMSTDGSFYSIIHNFTGGADGGNPSCGLIQGSGSDNSLYGAAYNGGANGVGIVFQLAVDGSVFSTIHNFIGVYGANPYDDESLTLGSDGMLYGTTLNGGDWGAGTVFQVSTSGTVFNSLHSFNPNAEGYNPYGGVIQGSDGLLHGVTPYSSYGSANNYGTLFTLTTSGASFTTAFDFSNGIDGYDPYGGLALGKDGNFYGTTVSGGLYGYGTLFKISKTGQLTLLHSFSNIDGYAPYCGITLDSKSNLYATTTFGGANSHGVAFEYSPSTGIYTLLHSFIGADGVFPDSGVTLIGTSLYGVTEEGGANGYGVVYKITLPTATKPSTFKVLHSFNSSDGASSSGSLIEGSDRNLYGVTNFGGAFGYGTVFKISPTTGTLTTLHSFNLTDGSNVYAGLIQGRDGMLYGTTLYGGVYGNGTVFQISTNGSVFNVLHNFNVSDGQNPFSTLLQGSDGMLYGTTSGGGDYNYGMVFNLSTDGSVFNSLHSFGVFDGSDPSSGVVEGPDGNLYGTTFFGSVWGYGTVYRLNTLLPLVSSFSPTSGSASAGTTVTVKGVNLGSAGAVTIAGVSQTILSKTATSVKFRLNASTPVGIYPIVVTTPNGTATSAKKFTVNP